jgi:hypothetical protein
MDRNNPLLVVHPLLLGESHGVLIPVTTSSFYSDPQGELVPHIWWFSSGDPDELLEHHQHDAFERWFTTVRKG